VPVSSTWSRAVRSPRRRRGGGRGLS
jgi:hypothetical protein